MVQPPGDGKAEAERQQHAGDPHAQSHPPVVGEQADVDLEADEEEEQEEAEVGDIVEDGHGGRREDLILEVRDPRQDGRAQENAADDLGDDPGLADERQRVVQQAAEDYNDTSLKGGFTRE